MNTTRKSPRTWFGRLMNMLSWVLTVAAIGWFGMVLWAMGTTDNAKGSLSREEIDFISQTVFPILIASHYCTRANGDCVGEFIFCSSHETLSCDVYGIDNSNVRREILDAALKSNIKFSSLRFWQSKHSQEKFFEKPVMRFENNAANV